MARRYDLECPVARTLDVIGDRWTALILRELFQYRDRRFQDLERAFDGLTPSVLSARLKDLEANGVITSRFYTTHPPRHEYFLTPKGRKLGPVLMAMMKWGEENT